MLLCKLDKLTFPALKAAGHFWKYLSSPNEKYIVDKSLLSRMIIKDSLNILTHYNKKFTGLKCLMGTCLIKTFAFLLVWT